MNSEHSILSIVIPTRNRQPYAMACVEQILKSTPSDVEVVIQDNSDDSTLLEMLQRSAYFERIKYNYTPGVVSFVDNFSLGVEQASGKYICMIGDDDGINPEIVEAVRWANKKNLEAIVPSIRLNYIWPESGITHYGPDTGNLMIIDFDAKSNIYDPKLEVKKLLASGGQNYLNYNMVKVYHGIVTKAALDRVKAITGRYFGGVSPDIYSSVALSLVIDKLVKIDYPLTIPGVCKTSGAGSAATGSHVGKLEDAPQLKGHLNYQWSEFVPRFYSVETVWAESVMACLKQMKRPDLIKEFSVCALAAYCNKYKDYQSINEENLRAYFAANQISGFKQVFYKWRATMNGPFADFTKKVANRLKRGRNSVKTYNNVFNIEEAEKIFKQHQVEKNMSFKSLIPQLDRLF